MIDFEALKGTIYLGVLDALQEHASYIAGIPRTAQGGIPMTGLSLELYPWHRYIAMSLRSSSDVMNRYSSADWEHFEFISSRESGSEPFRTAAVVVTETYDAAGDDLEARKEAAHLIFLAAAEALLEPSVAGALQSMGIEASVFTDRLDRGFEFMVFDSDETLKANYCEIVRSNRVTRRLLKRDA
jgi:hypothetical protein